MPIREWNAKVAVVTGAARGLGAALSAGLIRRGATVVLVDRNPAVAETANTTTEKSGLFTTASVMRAREPQP